MTVEAIDNVKNDQNFSKCDYYGIYLEEKKAKREVEMELAFHRVELEKFKHEAAKAYVLSKIRRQDSAMMSAQADKILKDLHAVNRDLRLKVAELDKAKKNNTKPIRAKQLERSLKRGMTSTLSQYRLSIKFYTWLRVKFIISLLQWNLRTWS